MDLHVVAEQYIQRLIQASGNKPRILLLDQDTTPIISLVSTQTELLKHDVFLVDRLDNTSRQKMRHLDCIAVLRPTADAISLLVEELRRPNYASYALYFTNVVKKSHLERLAESDDHEVVASVIEMYLDMAVISKYFFTAQCPQIYSSLGAWDSLSLERCVEALGAVLLSLKINPQIRYEANSSMCRKLAQNVQRSIEQQGQLFDFRSKDPVLLILSRENDPVTPLLTHWTYQAMVDELLGIRNNRIDLEAVPEISQDLKEAVLAQDQDSFFAEAMYLNFGDLGARIREYVSHYQTKTKSNSNIETIADMKRFVEEFPEFRKLGSNVSKHVALVGELSRQVDAQKALDVSEVEQSLATSENHNNDLRSIQEIIRDPAVLLATKYRLVGLYALHYEQNQNNQTAALLDLIELGGGDELLRRAVENLLVYSNTRSRQEDIFGTSTLLGRAQMGLKGLKGVENVYTQHRPLLTQTLDLISKGKLKKPKYPFLGHAPPGEDSPVPAQVVVFIIGGATYEEARIVAEFNKHSHTKVVLGSNASTNGGQFLSSLAVDV